MSGAGATIVTIERIRMFLLGMGAGLMIAVFYLRGTSLSTDTLWELRDGASLLLLVSMGLLFWPVKSAATPQS